MVRRSSTISAAFLTIALCVPLQALAQDAPRPGADAPAHISLVEGIAALERDGRTDEAPANMPLLAGDRVRTRAGRVEILFADGSTLHLDHNTTIDLQSDELVRLLDGRIRLSIPGRARDVAYRIDGPHAWAQIAEAGEYRAAVIQNAGLTELEFAVLRGSAELMNEAGRTPLRAGERAFARADAAPSYAYVFNSASWDPFDRWSEGRRNERLALSTQYLPDEVRPYAGTLDRYGDWQYESSYGYVWYPRVDVGWRPYYRGRWSSLRPYGWTWIGSDAWAWPTHHYGRWGFSAGLWFWIPGRSWSPAWVSWAYAPGYVSWCPLGFNNRPVVQIVNVNVHRGYDPWRAWTVIPQRDFGVGFVNRRVIQSVAIDERTRSSFVSRDAAPEITGYAVARGSGAAPIRVAGTSRVRTATSPMLSNREGAAPDIYRGAPPSRSVDRSDLTRRPAATPPPDGRMGATATRERTAVPERTVPDRPLIRSDRESRSPQVRTVEPSVQPGTAPADIRRTPEATRERSPYGRTTEGYGRTTEGYGRTDGSRVQPGYEAPDRRAVPRPEYGRPATGSSPYGADRPANRAPGYERRQPSAERPSQPAAQPSPAPGPGRTAPARSAPPPSGGRARPSGGDNSSRGTAVRRPGGGG
jgi:hypothetical protein